MSNSHLTHTNDDYEQTFLANKKNVNIFLTIIATELSKLLSSKQFQYLKRCNKRNKNR